MRELENVIERVMILCPNDIITGADLPTGFKNNVDNALHLDGIPPGAQLYQTLEMVEKVMIQRALKMADNVQSHAAEILGIGKSGLNQKIKRYNLEVPPKTPRYVCPCARRPVDPKTRSLRLLKRANGSTHACVYQPSTRCRTRFAYGESPNSESRRLKVSSLLALLPSRA